MPQTLPEHSPVTALQAQHRSVRRFLEEPVTDAELELIVRSAQRASTSSNLQCWSVVAIRDQDRKERISRLIGGRDYVEQAPVFLVWIADLARNRELLRSRGTEPETLGYIENTLLCALDIGIAAENALLAAESIGLGGVFVGSVRNAPDAVSAELGLPQNAFPMVGMSLGRPDPDEGTGIKPRLPLSGVLHEERYDPERWREATAVFEEADREYFEGQGVADRSWARTVERRLATPAGLHGRDTMRASLEAQGFASL